MSLAAPKTREKIINNQCNHPISSLPRSTLTLSSPQRSPLHLQFGPAWQKPWKSRSFWFHSVVAGNNTHKGYTEAINMQCRMNIFVHKGRSLQNHGQMTSLKILQKVRGPILLEVFSLSCSKSRLPERCSVRRSLCTSSRDHKRPWSLVSIGSSRGEPWLLLLAATNLRVELGETHRSPECHCHLGRICQKLCGFPSQSTAYTCEYMHTLIKAWLQINSHG